MNDYIAPLTADQFTRETDYQAVRSITKTLLAHGIINQAEYKKLIQYFLPNTALLSAFYSRKRT